MSSQFSLQGVGIKKVNNTHKTDMGRCDNEFTKKLFATIEKHRKVRLQWNVQIIENVTLFDLTYMYMVFRNYSNFFALSYRNSLLSDLTPRPIPFSLQSLTLILKSHVTWWASVNFFLINVKKNITSSLLCGGLNTQPW